LLVGVIEGRGLVCIRDGCRKNADAGDACTICDAESTNVVLDSRDFTSTARAMLIVVEPWFRKSGVIVIIPRSFGKL
jgi:hypothetical protein